MKLLLALVLPACLVAVLWTGYVLFFARQIDPVLGTLVFVVEVGLSVWVMYLLRGSRYRWRTPSFNLVFFSILGIALVCAFAGIEPLASYKDSAMSWVSKQGHEAAESSQLTELAPAEPSPIQPAPAQEDATSSATDEEQVSEETQKEDWTLSELEREAFRLVNVERECVGVPPTQWDDELYSLSKAHTQEMAERGELFHTPIGASYGENCWGGKGYYHYRDKELARSIVDSWMSSPLHRAWLLHEPIRTSVVSIVLTPDGQYASWTFWTSEVGQGPELIRKIADEWQRETGGNTPWLEWLEMKGYIKGEM